MKVLSEALLKEKEVEKVINAIDGGGCPALISGVNEVHMANIISAAYSKTERPIFVICSDDMQAKKLSGDISAFTGVGVSLLTGRDFTFYNAETVSRQAEHRRLGVLYKMAREKSPVTVATAEAVLQRTIPVEKLLSASVTLEVTKEYDIRDICLRLTNAGYARSEQVEGVGQYSLRGGILDFFSPAEEQPVRCEFFGDEIDSMGYFDVRSQRRTEMIKKAVIIPSSETLVTLADWGKDGAIAALEGLLNKKRGKKSLTKEQTENILKDIERIKNGRSFSAADKYVSLFYDKATAMDYVLPDAVIFLDEPMRLGERTKNYAWQLGEDITELIKNGAITPETADISLSWDEILEKLREYPVIMMDNFTSGTYPINVRTYETLRTKQLPSYGGSLETAASDISHYMKTKYSMVVLCQNKSRAQILSGYLKDHDIGCTLDFSLEKLPERGKCTIAVGALSAGYEYPDIKLTVITEGQIMQQAFRKKVKRHADKNRQKLESYADLSTGDLVVHENYGIGRFVGIVKMPVDKIEKDYIKIAFAGTDSLYVPATQLDLVSKYIGAGEDKPVKLSKMGGTDWVKAKTRAKGAAKELAKGLIQLQAERRRQPGYAFSPDNSWQTEFEEAFEYNETDDQLRSIEEIKKDMEKPVPMDRLLCGDVGYGKTEVAMRAIMKCVMDGKQAAVLVPTTVLAQQHYTSAMKRFSGYPVKIAALSRFRTAAQLKQTVKEIGDGSVDIIIGTHKLLQKDIRFKDLGLLVVDEEQRFGVNHKERLKEIAKQVDVLTLSATPIPRTLNMALSGVRDMSTIEEPPQDRLPVQTYVIEHDWGIVCDAIRQELSRGGQVYYLHNRAESIERTASRIAAMIEGITVGVAHGKMDEEQLSTVMERMSAGDIQVLVCTTIIETGIDIPNVNTLIIEDADKLGLAQLHQIRGRVGRSSRRAFAYLTFRQGKVLTEIANKRLSAIREFAEFNSGFKIAMRDLEIRGAGNILGAEQSGHMMNVGYDMYLKLLEEAVLEEKGGKKPVRTECSADLSVAANIPESYVPSGEQRMDLYRRIAHIRSEEDADDITDELIDRFGDPPRSVNTLLYIAILRGEAEGAGISEITQKGNIIRFKLTDFDLEKISRLYEEKEYKGKVKIEAGTVPAVSFRIDAGKNSVDQALKFVRDYKSA